MCRRSAGEGAADLALALSRRCALHTQPAAATLPNTAACPTTALPSPYGPRCQLGRPCGPVGLGFWHRAAEQT